MHGQWGYPGTPQPPPVTLLEAVSWHRPRLCPRHLPLPPTRGRAMPPGSWQGPRSQEGFGEVSASPMEVCSRVGAAGTGRAGQTAGEGRTDGRTAAPGVSGAARGGGRAANCQHQTPSARSTLLEGTGHPRGFLSDADQVLVISAISLAGKKSTFLYRCARVSRPPSSPSPLQQLRFLLLLSSPEAQTRRGQGPSVCPGGPVPRSTPRRGGGRGPGAAGSPGNRGRSRLRLASRCPGCGVSGGGAELPPAVFCFQSRTSAQ